MVIKASSEEDGATGGGMKEDKPSTANPVSVISEVDTGILIMYALNQGRPVAGEMTWWLRRPTDVVIRTHAAAHNLFTLLPGVPMPLLTTSGS